MNMDQAAVFLAGSILTVIGFLVIVGGVLVVNNLVAKYWKSWGWTFFAWVQPETTRFITPEEAARVAPILKEEDGKSK